MSPLFLLPPQLMAKRAPFFPRSHAVPRVDDRRVIPGMIDGIRDGLRWNNAPNADGPHKTLDNPFVRWRRLGLLQRKISACIPAGGKRSHPAISLSWQTKDPSRRV